MSNAPATDFVNANPLVLEWYSKVAKKREGKSTPVNYPSNPRLYWIGHLAEKYPNIETWLKKVRKRSKW
jgi:hypothetical protein